MKAILCSNQAEFDALDLKVKNYWNSVLCPPQGSTDKWTDPKVNAVNGEIWFTVEDIILPALTEEEKDRIVESNGNGAIEESMGFDSGLGFRIAIREKDQVKFTVLMTYLKNKSLPSDTPIKIFDMTGKEKVITYAQFKALYDVSGDYCVQLAFSGVV